MHFLSMLIFVISSTCDSFVVGISYGIKKIKIGYISNLIVAVISGFGTFISMAAGKVFSRYFFARNGKIIGSVILIILGIYFLYDSTKNKIDSSDSSVLKNPEAADKDKSKSIEYKEAFMLGAALSLNNIGIGLGASFAGMNVYASAFLAFLMSFIFIKLGRFLGESIFAKVLSVYAQLVSAIIIILLGVYELF